jgi:hypothetical protein
LPDSLLQLISKYALYIGQNRRRTARIKKEPPKTYVKHEIGLYYGLAEAQAAVRGSKKRRPD